MTFDQLIQTHIDVALGPLQKTISELQEKIDEYEKEKPFLIDGRRVIRRGMAAQVLQMNSSTLDKLTNNPHCPFQTIKVGRMTYYFVDSLDLTSEQVRKLNEYQI